MKTPALATLAVLALTAAFAPLPAPAAGASAGSYDLVTRQYDPMSAGEYDGRLRLQISPDGIVGGTFTDTEGHTSLVTGGLTGKKIWLQLGDRGAARGTFNGTFSHGKLKALAPHGLHTWTLEGTPRTNY